MMPTMIIVGIGRRVADEQSHQKYWSEEERKKER